MKLPALQFYPGDWRKDPGVQSLNYFDRGVWFEILCLMHESSERGKLLLNGKPMPDDALATILGLDKQILTTTLNTLLTYGVASRDGETGALINRRMVKDETLRQVRTEAGKKGGNPVLVKQSTTKRLPKAEPNGNHPAKQKSTPSSSSSVSSSEDSAPRGGPKPRDPLLDHEAVMLYRDVCHLTPNHEQRKLIAERVTDCDLYGSVLRKFMQEGQPPNHVDWTLERYSENGTRVEKKLTPEERTELEEKKKREKGWDKFERTT